MAANQCSAGLNKYPGDGNLLCLSARANIALRKFPEAKAIIEKTIRQFPDFALAHETLGDVLMVQGHAESARRAYEQAMRLDPSRLSVHEKIDRAREQEKKVDAAMRAQSKKKIARKALSFEREIAEALQHERNDDGKAAEEIYRRILTTDPNHAEAGRLLARVAAGKKRFRDARVILHQVLKNAPDYTRALADLCNVQRELGDFDAAVESAKKVIELAPGQAESYVLLASAIGMVGDHQDAIDACEKALAISADKPGAICTLAHHLKTVGKQDEAIARYRQCIDVQPDHAEAYWSLANLKTFRFEDSEIAAMNDLLEKDDLNEVSRAQIHNALGLEHEGRKNYDLAFDNFEKCNLVQRKLESYDPVDNESFCQRSIEMFDEEYMQKRGSRECSGVTPIFVVGLPRSGSTLIEQILASHSLVDATHELGDLTRVLQSAHRKWKKKGDQLPDGLKALEKDDWLELGQEYLQRTAVFRGKAPFFVDKNPNNFTFAGAIKLALPNAKIIDAQRHPLDSCFGTYKQLFASGQPFSYDLTEIGEYYVQYRRLMKHWRDVAPDSVLDVQYELVVADLETQVRRILEFCGLPFEEACLRFHETERAVKTASSEQVRKPIYSSSVNLWRNYEDHLETLVHILEPQLAKLSIPDRPVKLSQSRLPAS